MKLCDNRVVNVVSSFARSLPINKVQRYDSKKKKKTVVGVTRLDAISQYNKYMASVDLADCLIAFYRINMRSKKYYHRLGWHGNCQFMAYLQKRSRCLETEKEIHYAIVLFQTGPIE